MPGDIVLVGADVGIDVVVAIIVDADVGVAVDTVIDTCDAVGTLLVGADVGAIVVCADVGGDVDEAIFVVGATYVDGSCKNIQASLLIPRPLRIPILPPNIIICPL